MLLTTATYFIFILTALGFCSRLYWVFTILDFFRLQFSITAALLFVTTVFFGNMVLALLNLASFAINLYRMRHFIPRFSKKIVHPKSDIFVVNAYKKNKEPQSLKKTLQEVDPIIVLILEMTDNLRETLSPVLELYPHKIEVPARDGFNMCLLSKISLNNSEIVSLGENRTPFIKADIEINKQTYRLYSAHPKPVLNKTWFNHRHDYFQKASELILESDMPVIMLGDLNSVPWENHFQKFLDETNLHCTLKDHGYKMTWPTYMPILGVPMDHILITNGHKYGDLKIGPFVGSDHYPISIKF